MTKCGSPLQISNGEIRSVSEQQGKHVIAATPGSSMASRHSLLISVIDSRIGPQQNSHSLLAAVAGSVDKGGRLEHPRQARVDINRTTRNQRLNRRRIAILNRFDRKCAALFAGFCAPIEKAAQAPDSYFVIELLRVGNK